jgi:hypothetical protein
MFQFLQIDKKNPPFQEKDDFIIAEKIPEPLAWSLQKACYDCHSYETQYPYWIHNHINEGRSHLNFSLWAKYSKEEQKELKAEIWEEIIKNKMPLKTYIFMHKDAHLNPKEKKSLEIFLKEIM